MTDNSDGKLILDAAANVANPFLSTLGSTQQQFKKQISPIVISAIKSLVDIILPEEDEDVYTIPWNLTEQMRQRQHTRRKILKIIKEIEVITDSEYYEKH
jgi:hypothetical protein